MFCAFGVPWARDKGRWLDGTVRSYAQNVPPPSLYVVMILPSVPAGSGMNNSEATYRHASLMKDG